MSDIQVFWLEGAYCSRRHILHEMRSKLGEHEYHVFWPDSTFESIRETILTVGAFEDEKQIIVLYGLPGVVGKGIDKRKKAYKQILAEYKDILETVPEGNFVIINGIPKSDCPKLSEHVEDIGHVFEYPTYIASSDARVWVFESLSERGIEAEDDDIKTFVDKVGEQYQKGVNFDLLSLSLDKVVSYVGENKSMTAEDVDAVLEDNKEYITWDLYAALDEKDFQKCMVLFYRIARNAVNLTAAVELLIPSLLWKFRMLSMLKNLKVNGATQDEIQSFMSGVGKLNKEPKVGVAQAKYSFETGREGVKPQFSPKAIGVALRGYYGSTSAVDRYTEEDLYNIIDCLEDCAINVRLNNSDIAATTMVDNIFMTVCRLVGSSKLKELRRFPE